MSHEITRKHTQSSPILGYQVRVWPMWVKVLALVMWATGLLALIGWVKACAR